MKKLLILALTVIMAIGAGGCGQDKADAKEAKQNDTARVEEKEHGEDKAKQDEDMAMNDSEESSADKEKMEEKEKPEKQEMKAETKQEVQEKAPQKKMEEDKKSEQKPTQPVKEDKKMTPEQAPEQKVAEAKAPEAPKSKYKDGTFSGSASGYHPTTKLSVSVTISNDKITSIKVGNNAEDAIYLDDAKGVIDKIIKAQSTNVDAVAGATYSSEGIKNAVKVALESAKN